jgi:hypothetical protein
MVTICELETGWAASENERRYLHWELLACDEIRGVFQTDREHTLAVLYDGDRFGFRTWADSLEATHEQGAHT